jgi:hypothetical protein
MTSRLMNRLLAAAGRNGPVLLLVGVMIGLVVPPLAQAARPLMDLAAFGFTLGTFLKVDLASFRAEVVSAGARRNLAVLAWVGLGVPLAASGLVALLEPGQALAQGIMLCTIAPPIVSATAIAAMLGLSTPLALAAAVAATLVAPVAMPWLATMLGGYELGVDPMVMALRLAVIIGGACLASWALRRWARAFVVGSPAATTGISILSLIVFAVGAMHGMQALLLREPALVLTTLLAAFALNAGFQVLGALVFAASGRRAGLTVGLLSGNRSVGLAWAAVGSALTPGIELFLAMSLLPIYILPLLMRPLVAGVLARATRTPEGTVPRMEALVKQGRASGG